MIALIAALLMGIAESYRGATAVRICKSLIGKSHAWPRHEVYRGWIAGIMLLSASQFIG